MAKIEITDHQILLNGDSIFECSNGDILTQAYRALGISYPKFFKMDNLSRLGFLAAELLLKGEGVDTDTPKPDFALLIANRYSCLDTDIAFQTTIQDPENYFPSPSIFVYTLPNIVMGEIAIRYKLMGENSFLIASDLESADLPVRTKELFQNTDTQQLLVGWIDYFDHHAAATLELIKK